MPFRDSIDKIVTSYFAAVTKQPFTYKGITYEPKRLDVSPLLFRGYTCPQMCGGCCPRFSLDYLPTEKRPDGVSEREVLFDGRPVSIWSDLQDDHDDHYCRNLNKTDGRCKVYVVRPFSCDFELIKFINCTESEDKFWLNQKLYSRGWAMTRVDEGRGALCEMTDPDADTVEQVIRKLKRLKQWTDHFGLDTWVDDVRKWVEDGPHDLHRPPLVLTPDAPITLIQR